MIAAPSLHGSDRDFLLFVFIFCLSSYERYFCHSLILCAEELLASCQNAKSVKVNRGISTGRLHMLPCFHLRPINVVFFHGSDSDIYFRAGLPA